MKTPDEADSTEPALVISLTASERSTDARACPWTRIEPCVTGLVASFQTLDEQSQPVRLGVVRRDRRSGFLGHYICEVQ